MKSFFRWLKEDLILQFKVGLKSLKISFLIFPLYLILQIGSYLYFKDSLYQNAFWVLSFPSLVVLAIVIPYLYTKRNNPDYISYYIFHLSKVSIILIIIGTLFLIGIYFIAQCREYSFPVGKGCLVRIFGGYQ